MFTKKPDKEPIAFDVGRTMPPAPPSGPMPTAMPTMGRPTLAKAGESRIGPDLAIIGNLVSKGEIQIDGEVQGDLHAANIIVGESARITGGIVAD